MPQDAEIEALARKLCREAGVDPDQKVDLNRTTSQFLQDHGLEKPWGDAHIMLDVLIEGPAWQAFAERAAEQLKRS